MASISVVAPSSGHHAGVMILQRLSIALRTEALIRYILSAFCNLYNKVKFGEFAEYYCGLHVSQVYIIGGDGTQRGASVIFEVIRSSLIGP